jgi:HK97 family phage major capsid protein
MGILAAPTASFTNLITLIMGEEIKVDVEVDETQDEAVKSILDAVSARVEAGLETKTAEIKRELNEQVKAWGEKNAPTKSKTVVEFDSKAFDAWSKAVKGGSKGDFEMEIKDLGMFLKSTAADMAVADNFTGVVAISELDPVISRDPQRQPFIEQLVSVGTMSAPIDTWIETTNETGNPLPVAELAAIPQKDYEFAESTANAKKIAVLAKYSKEMADDLPNVLSEVRNFLLSDLRREVDRQILAGNGTVTSSEGELKGILGYATSFAAGALADSVIEPNNFDVIEAAATQVIVGLHTPNIVVVHPTDVAKMNLSKADDGHYVMPPFITAGGATVSGVRVVSNTAITPGDFLIGDFSRSTVKYRQGVTVELSNSDADDFSRDRFTIKTTVRLAHRVRANDSQAFVKGTFATAIAALDAAS